MINVPPVSKGMSSHPYTVPNPGSLPVSLRPAAEQALAGGEPVDLIFVVPAQVAPRGWFGFRRFPEQALLFTSQGVLHVQAGLPQATYLPAAGLLYAHLSLILLYGRLELAGLANGALTRIVVEFNTVAEWLLEPGLHQLVRLAWGQAAVPAEVQAPPASGQLDRLPMKFGNGLRYHGLQPDERLLGLVFQPGIWRQYRRFFRQQVAATTLLALTDRQLIILEEDKNGKHANYGWIFTFCPLAGVAGTEVKAAESWQEVQIHLEREGVAVDRQVTLEPEMALAWQDLWNSYAAVEPPYVVL